MRSTANVEYASKPSSSQPMGGNNLKKRLIIAASLARAACLKFFKKTSRKNSRDVLSDSDGGRGNSELG